MLPTLIFRMFAGVFLLATLCYVSPAQAEISIVDDTQTTITLQEPAQRIVALYDGFYDILDVMGLNQRIVARIDSKTPRPELDHLPLVGGYAGINPERIVAAKPDLVLQFITHPAALAQAQDLRKRGLTVAVFTAKSMEQLNSCVTNLGILTAEQEKAQALCDSVQSRVDVLTNQIKATSNTKPKVFFELRYPNLLGAGSETLAGDIINQLGGQNIIAKPSRASAISEAELFRQNPDVYIVQRGPLNPAPENIAARPGFANLKAVRNNNVIIVDEDVFSHPSPKTLEAIEEMVSKFHPS